MYDSSQFYDCMARSIYLHCFKFACGSRLVCQSGNKTIGVLTGSPAKENLRIHAYLCFSVRLSTCLILDQTVAVLLFAKALLLHIQKVLAGGTKGCWSLSRFFGYVSIIY